MIDEESLPPCLPVSQVAHGVAAGLDSDRDSDRTRLRRRQASRLLREARELCVVWIGTASRLSRCYDLKDVAMREARRPAHFETILAGRSEHAPDRPVGLGDCDASQSGLQRHRPPKGESGPLPYQLHLLVRRAGGSYGPRLFFGAAAARIHAPRASGRRTGQRGDRYPFSDAPSDGDSNDRIGTTDLLGFVVNLVTGERNRLARTLAKYDDVAGMGHFGTAADAKKVGVASAGRLK